MEKLLEMRAVSKTLTGLWSPELLGLRSNAQLPQDNCPSQFHSKITVRSSCYPTGGDGMEWAVYIRVQQGPHMLGKPSSSTIADPKYSLQAGDCTVQKCILNL